MNDHERQLIEELRDPNYRETYAEQHVNALLATQIAVIRDQRGMTQTALARQIGKQQPAISRIENVNYARWNVRSLREVARALGCWLNIRFASWSDLVRDVETYSTDSLRVNRYEDDPLCFGSEAQEGVSEPIRWVQKQLLPWLDSDEDNARLEQLLAGSGLTLMDDFDPPSIWLLRAVEVEPPGSPYRHKLASRALSLLNEIEGRAFPESVPDEVYSGIFTLLAAFPMEATWLRLKAFNQDPARSKKILPVSSHSAFLGALIRNQVDHSLEKEWLSTIRNGHHRWLEANEFDGFDGLKWMRPGPQTLALAKGLSEMYEAKFQRPESGIDFVDLMENLRETFQVAGTKDPLQQAGGIVTKGQPFFGLSLFMEGKRAEWQSMMYRAWSDVFGPDFEGETPLLLQKLTDTQKMPPVYAVLGASGRALKQVPAMS